MGLFKRKTPLERLNIQYKELLEQSYKLSTSNRAESDKKTSEAEQVLMKIKELEANKS